MLVLTVDYVVCHQVDPAARETNLTSAFRPLRVPV